MTKVFHPFSIISGSIPTLQDKLKDPLFVFLIFWHHAAGFNPEHGYHWKVMDTRTISNIIDVTKITWCGRNRRMPRSGKRRPR